MQRTCECECELAGLRHELAETVEAAEAVRVLLRDTSVMVVAGTNEISVLRSELADQASSMCHLRTEYCSSTATKVAHITMLNVELAAVKKGAEDENITFRELMEAKSGTGNEEVAALQHELEELAAAKKIAMEENTTLHRELGAGNEETAALQHELEQHAAAGWALEDENIALHGKLLEFITSSPGNEELAALQHELETALKEAAEKRRERTTAQSGAGNDEVAALQLELSKITHTMAATTESLRGELAQALQENQSLSDEVNTYIAQTDPSAFYMKELSVMFQRGEITAAEEARMLQQYEAEQDRLA